MNTQLSEDSKCKLDVLLENVGDMSLKRRVKTIVDGLDLRQGDKIIDVGCGDGYFLYLLSNLPINKISLTGFDHDKVVLNNARKNLDPEKKNYSAIKLLEGTATKMPFKDKSFNKAIMTEVLEHIDNDKKALAEVYRILQPNGILVLTVPNYNYPFLWDPLNRILQNFIGIHLSGTGFFAGIWARHLRLYEKKELEELIKRVGFEIEKVNELTTRVLPFNHYMVNLVARFLYDIKPSPKLADPLSKFKNARKPLLIKLAFYLVNLFDRLNDVIPGKHGLNIYIKARKAI